ncbi:MAG: GNAT family N-acetyltransferase [Paracoccaceae bacterium]
MTPTIRLATPADAAWVIQTHATHYAENDGFDDSFRLLVSEIVTDFFAKADPATERGWIACDGATPIGCIFCAQGPDRSAKLRLFYLAPSARGTGLAQTLLDTCLTFARSAGYPAIRLWTHESHRAAGRLYARNHFTLIESAPVRSFGQDLVTQTWERML